MKLGRIAATRLEKGAGSTPGLGELGLEVANDTALRFNYDRNGLLYDRSKSKDNFRGVEFASLRYCPPLFGGKAVRLALDAPDSRPESVISVREPCTEPCGLEPVRGQVLARSEEVGHSIAIPGSAGEMFTKFSQQQLAIAVHVLQLGELSALRIKSPLNRHPLCVHRLSLAGCDVVASRNPSQSSGKDYTHRADEASSQGFVPGKQASQKLRELDRASTILIQPKLREAEQAEYQQCQSEQQEIGLVVSIELHAVTTNGTLPTFHYIRLGDRLP
jgi:hypothetical protein